MRFFYRNNFDTHKKVIRLFGKKNADQYRLAIEITANITNAEMILNATINNTIANGLILIFFFLLIVSAVLNYILIVLSYIIRAVLRLPLSRFFKNSNRRTLAMQEKR